MDEKTNEILSKMDKEDLLTLCRAIDISTLIQPMASHKKQYDKQVKFFGTLNNKSVMIQKLLPGKVCDLYIKGDENYKDVLSKSLNKLKLTFNETLSSCYSSNFKFENIPSESVENIVKLFYKYNEISGKAIELDFFILMLKINNAEIDESIVNQVKDKIKQDQTLKELKKTIDIEKDKELKHKEKEIAIKYEHQKELMLQNIRNLQKKIEKEEANNSYLKQEIDELKRTMKMDQDVLLKLYINKYKEDLNIKKEKLNEAYNQKIEEFDNECKSEIQKLKTKFEESKEEIKSQKLALLDEISSLESKKITLNIFLQDLNEQITDKESEIKGLDKYIDEYFAGFDSKILDRKIENALGNKYLEFAKLTPVVQTNENNSTTLIQKESNIIIDNARTVPMGNCYSDYNENLKDFIHDFSDNLTLFLEEPTEIAANILSALLNHKSIILPECLGEKVTESLSILIDLSTPLVVDVSAGKINPNEIISVIKNSDSQIIYIIGLLDNFEEGILNTICRKCIDRFVFFSISDVSVIKMMSNSILNNTITLDVEKYMTFEENEDLITGSYDLNEFVIPVENKTYQIYLRKYFSGLVNAGYISKKQALDFSMYSNTYFSLIDSDVLGCVFKDVVLKSCKDISADDVEAIQALKKCGIELKEL